MIKSILKKIMYEKLVIGDETYTRRRFLPNLLFKTLNYEEYLDDVYKAFLDVKEGAIVDVGANTGQTVFKMLSMDKDRKYLGFEPLNISASCIESFLIENNIKNYYIFPVALSDQNGAIPINIRGRGIYSMASTVSSIVEGFRPKEFYSYAKYIYAARGDDVIYSLDIPSIALIKIDVEGAELEVVRGMQNTVQKYRPFILFEVLHHYLVVTKEEIDDETKKFRENRVQELESIIRSKEYFIYQIVGGSEIAKVKKIIPDVVNDLSTTDYIAIPYENEKEFCAHLSKSRLISIK